MNKKFAENNKTISDMKEELDKYKKDFGGIVDDKSKLTY